MNREVDLLSYLPPFLQEFKENRETLEAENPEFVLVWRGVDRVLKNEFIETADEYGIARFESILKITSSANETLEFRRQRVFFRWFNKTPYTFRVFVERLAAICGENSFAVIKDFKEKYRIDITVDLEVPGLVDEVDRLIREMMPCNMVVVSINQMPCKSEGDLFAAGTVCFVEHIEIVDGGIKTDVVPYEIAGIGCMTGAVSHMEHIEITDKLA